MRQLSASSDNSISRGGTPPTWPSCAAICPLCHWQSRSVGQTIEVVRTGGRRRARVVHANYFETDTCSSGLFVPSGGRHPDFHV